MKYIPVIGIEIHLELLTDSKMFSPSKASFNDLANTNVSPIDLALPGTLPIVNMKAVEQAIKVAKVFNCQIDQHLHFDRKNYFYSDLPKGYQITQYFRPVGSNGHLDIIVNGVSKTVEIERVHIEEDTAKQFHLQDEILLDYNRAGIPLVEIVTGISFSSPEEVEVYLTTVKNLMEFIGVSDAKMEEGSMRCDLNVSIAPAGAPLGTRVEIKNINSITNARKALEFEIKRQETILEQGGKVTQETRRFDDQIKQTVFMRDKSNAVDYKYFSESNIFPIYIDDNYLQQIVDSIGLLPEHLIAIYQKQGLSYIDASIIAYKKSYRQFLQSIIEDDNFKQVVKLLLGDVAAILNAANLELSQTKLQPAMLVELAVALASQSVSSKHNKLIITTMIEEGLDLKTIAQKHQLVQNNDVESLRALAIKIIGDNPSAIEDIKNGRDRAYQFLVGQMFKLTKGQANPSIAASLIKEEVAKLL